MRLKVLWNIEARTLIPGKKYTVETDAGGFHFVLQAGLGRWVRIQDLTVMGKRTAIPQRRPCLNPHNL